MEQKVICPHCGTSNHVVKAGKTRILASGVQKQRYECKSKTCVPRSAFLAEWDKDPVKPKGSLQRDWRQVCVRLPPDLEKHVKNDIPMQQRIVALLRQHYQVEDS